MNTKLKLSIGLLLLLTLSACNLPVGPTAASPSASELATQAAIDQAFAQTAEAMPALTTPGLQAQKNGGLIITDVEVTETTFYYPRNTGCGPTSTTIHARVTSNAPITQVGVIRFFSPDYGSGRNDFMQPVGNGWYELTIPTPDYDNLNLSGDFNLRLLVYAKDSAGNRVSTGGDVDWEPPYWPLNQVQLQIPSVNMLYCQVLVFTPDTSPRVNIPTFTPTPYLELLPTNTATPYVQHAQPPNNPTDTPVPPPAPPTNTSTPSVQTRSNYVEINANQIADMDFSGAGELSYIPARSDDPRHGLGQNVTQGEGIMMALVSGTPSYDTCLNIPGWHTGVIVQAGETYCYLTANGIYGYFHIDKIENQGTEIDNWVIGLSYTVWIP